LATVAGFMDWEFAEVMLQGYPADCLQGTNAAPRSLRASAGTEPSRGSGGTVNVCPLKKNSRKHPHVPNRKGVSCASHTLPA